MLVERPPGEPGDCIFTGWAESKSQMIVPFIGRAHLVQRPWDLPKVDALERRGLLDDQTAIVLRDVDMFLLTHGRHRPAGWPQSMSRGA